MWNCSVTIWYEGKKQQWISVKDVIRRRAFNFDSSAEDIQSQKTRVGVD